jgi:hypothetical protein
VKPIKTPMQPNGHLDLDEGGNLVDQTLYYSIIGSLLYLTQHQNHTLPMVFFNFLQLL